MLGSSGCNSARETENKLAVGMGVGEARTSISGCEPPHGVSACPPAIDNAHGAK
jgi:hypothetical protein